VENTRWISTIKKQNIWRWISFKYLGKDGRKYWWKVCL